MDSGRNFSFFEDGETLVEPEVAPVLASDIVSSPRVSNFVNSNIDLRFVTSDDGWRSKGEKRVLHSTHRERWWQNKNTVVAPDVRSEVVFSVVYEHLELVQLLGDCIKSARLGDNAHSSSKRPVLDVTDGNSDQIRSHADLVLKVVRGVGRIDLLYVGLVGTHLYLEL